MKAIKMTFRQLFFWIAGIWSLSVWGQDVQFTARVSRNEISLDDRLKVEFTANVNFERFTPPSFGDFHVLMGPMQSTNYSWINGRQSFSKSYTYILQPKKTGTLTIPPAKMVYRGKTYETQPVQVHVSEGVPPPAIKPGTTKNEKTHANGKDIFFRMELTTQNAYVNQAVGAIFRLYVKDGVKVGDLNLLDFSRFEGFWTENVSEEIQGPFPVEIDGVPYHYYDLRKVLLFPQRTGKLKITAQSIRINKYVQKEEDWGIFRQIVEVPEPVVVSTGSRFINVKPLPEKNKPEDFNDAVGQFRFKVETDKINVKTGEPLTVRITVSGTGNLGLFDLPKLTLPQSLEVYEPEHKKKVKATLSGLNGRVSDVYTVIPRQSGKYKIPSLHFSYFDPGKEQYVTLTSDPVDIEVTGQNITASTANTTGDHAEGLRFIHLKTQWKPVHQDHFFASKRFYIWIIILLILFPAAWGFKKWREAYYADTERLAHLQSERELKQYLTLARKETQNQTEFYAALEKALKTFLSSRLKLPASALTRENIVKTLNEKHLPENLINRFKEIRNRLDMARYSPLQTAEKENLLNEVTEWIKQTDKKLKS